MAFLDNSGDIILDAVLTDTGRMRLARGDGSFKITKYAFGDDEINYATYNGNHTSGSAYYDLEVLQTPVLEAFTNNAATMNSKLITISNNNLLYLPVLMLNSKDGKARPTANGNAIGAGTHVVLVDKESVKKVQADASLSPNGTLDAGMIDGFNRSPDGKHLRIDQGLNTDEISAEFGIDPELKETQYIVELDNRFGKLFSMVTKEDTTPSFIDDDQVASYYLSGQQYVTDSVQGTLGEGNAADSENEMVEGPRGTRLKLGVYASVDLRTSTFLFSQMGSELTTGGNTYYYIDTTLRVAGATTGYKVDIPVRFVKYKS
jgi:hypothetical protein